MVVIVPLYSLPSLIRDTSSLREDHESSLIFRLISCRAEINNIPNNHLIFSRRAVVQKYSLEMAQTFFHLSNGVFNSSFV